MLKVFFAAILMSATSAQAFETEGECASKAVIPVYQKIVDDAIATTFETIYTFKFDMLTKSSKLVEEGNIEHGPIYSVIVKDNSNNIDLEYTVEFTTTGCHFKRVEAVLSGEE